MNRDIQRSMKNLLLISVLLLWGTSHASEIDSYRMRFSPLEDSSSYINQKFNAYFQEALDEANQHRKRCSSKELYDQLTDRFKNHAFDEFTKWLTETDEVETISTRVTESIYKDFNIFQSLIQGGLARLISDPTGRVLNFNGIRVGTDKFEHMMGSGHKYFEIYYLENEPIQKVLEEGWQAETGMLGAFTTGVMSYGDMAANFQGMRFWNHVLQRGMDPLGENIGPYVKCQNYEWVQVKKVDLTHYIGPEHDEGNNCSRFRTPKMLKDVLNRLRDYEENDAFRREYKCPMEPKKIQKAKERYGAELSAWLINAKGHGHTKGDFKRPN